MFHIELIINTLRKNSGFNRITDKLYSDIVNAGLFKSFVNISPGIFKLECSGDDIYVELKECNGEYYLDVLKTQ